MTATSTLDAALRYAAAGWPVFPCAAGAKIPEIPSAHPAGDPARSTCRGECGRQRHGFKDATTSPDVIRSWWSRWPRANVAIATGAPGPDVLDVDAGGWEAFNRLQRAGLLAGAFAMVRTRSGGLHVYFAGTAQRCATRIGGTPLDYRSAGGYVLAPPSYVEADAKAPGGVYEVIDRRAYTGAAFDLQTAAALLAPPPQRAPPRRVPFEGADSGEAGRAVAWVLANAKPGYRHEPVRWLVKKLADAGQLDGAGAAVVLDVAERIQLAGGEREAKQIIRSYGGQV